jgi:hypothetical protein
LLEKWRCKWLTSANIAKWGAGLHFCGDCLQLYGIWARFRRFGRNVRIWQDVLVPSSSLVFDFVFIFGNHWLSSWQYLINWVWHRYIDPLQILLVPQVLRNHCRNTGCSWLYSFWQHVTGQWELTLPTRLRLQESMNFLHIFGKEHLFKNSTGAFIIRVSCPPLWWSSRGLMAGKQKNSSGRYRFAQWYSAARTCVNSRLLKLRKGWWHWTPYKVPVANCSSRIMAVICENLHLTGASYSFIYVQGEPIDWTLQVQCSLV